MDNPHESPKIVATLLTDADDALDAGPTLFRDRSFWGMTATQFLGAFNDNLFKQLMLLLAIPVGAAVELHDRPNPVATRFEEERESYEGWGRWNAHHWAQDQAGFAEFFFGQVFPEPYSTRQVEEAVGFAMETDAETLVATQSPKRRVLGPAEARAAAARVRCPALVLHGDDDRIAPLSDGVALARGIGCPIEVVAGGGHGVQARHPVWFNTRLLRFVEEVAAGARP